MAPVHIPVSIDDAMTMLDARIPLTHAERKIIVDGLYDLAYQEGAKAEKNRLLTIAEQLRDSDTPVNRGVGTVLAAIANTDVHNKAVNAQEYADPTAAIRERLTDKAAERVKTNERHVN